MPSLNELLAAHPAGPACVGLGSSRRLLLPLAARATASAAPPAAGTAADALRSSAAALLFTEAAEGVAGVASAAGVPGSSEAAGGTLPRSVTRLGSVAAPAHLLAEGPSPCSGLPLPYEPLPSSTRADEGAAHMRSQQPETQGLPEYSQSLHIKLCPFGRQLYTLLP